MTFPNDNNGNPNSVQAILAGVTSAMNDVPVMRVSSVTAGGTVTTSPLSADSSSVSAVQGAANLLRMSAFSNDASTMRVSAFGTFNATTSPLSADSSSVSAKQGDASLMRMSAFSNDASTFRVSALGVTVTTSPLSADSSSISAKQGDAALLRVSAIVDSGSISAKSNDASQLRISAFSDSATVNNVSAKSNDASTLRVSGFSNDASTMRTSAFQTDGTNQNVSAKSNDASTLRISAFSDDGAKLRVSSLPALVATSGNGALIAFTSSGLGSQVSTAKGTGGRLLGYHIFNPAGVDQYVQLFNTSAGATAGTDSPIMVLGVPTLGGAVNSVGQNGVAFGTGIQFVGTSTRNGNTMGASAMVINLFYI